MPKAFSHEDRAWARKQLGIAGELSPEELKRVYRKLALENHTDRGGRLERIQAINQAFEILKTPAPTRPQYSSARAAYAQAPRRPAKPTRYYALKLTPRELRKGLITQVNIFGETRRLHIPAGTSLDSVCVLDFGSCFVKIHIELDTSFGPMEKSLGLANIVFWCFAFYLAACVLGWCG